MEQMQPQEERPGTKMADAAGSGNPATRQTAPPHDIPAQPGVKTAPPVERSNDASGAKEAVGRPKE